VGDITVVDPDQGDTHTLSVNDERFEIAGQTLRLKPGVWLNPASASAVQVSITAQDSADPPGILIVSKTIDVLPNPTPWQNPKNPLDVDNNGHVEPLDVLLILNELNARGPLTLDPGISPPPPMYFDPSGDNLVTPLEALLIINDMNAQALGEGESRAAARDAVLAEENQWSLAAQYAAWSNAAATTGVDRNEKNAALRINSAAAE
jgi:hypothetical protein